METHVTADEIKRLNKIGEEWIHKEYVVAGPFTYIEQKWWNINDEKTDCFIPAINLNHAKLMANEMFIAWQLTKKVDDKYTFTGYSREGRIIHSFKCVGNNDPALVIMRCVEKTVKGE